ncbi:nitrate- and nitrite sensing domain-containing protein [Actinomadura sp. ATCC 31491]|uniref:histidine kinase n=1 Tax=Actinomadura luzonensis TaxID=2805427 RepID=A0ABT0FQP0_9ACTN|nr:nitrate- and nitrite sensing domain-containing protein [Actinomadura luzonensis]MCK2214473.1 nitrate- and nitrite sensing domain-containing protein [Actinomadura luzonensis]
MLLLPLLSLSALWGFVLNLTMGDAQSLLRANTLYRTIGVTSTDLGTQLQAERERSAEAITTREPTGVLGAQRARTDGAVEDFRRAVAEAGDAADGLHAPLAALTAALDRLGPVRADIDNGISSRLTGLTAYNRILDALFTLYDHLVSVSDLAILQQAGSLQAMGAAREQIAREHALVLAALADHRLTPPEVTAFTEYAASRRFLHARGMAGLDVSLRRPYEQIFASEPFQTFTAMEARIAQTGTPPADGAAWHETLDKLTGRLDKDGRAATEALAARTSDAATATVAQIAVAGGLGLIAVLASIIISVRFGRRLAGELGGLRAAAVELSDRRLPDLVARLRKGEDVDVRKEAKAIKVSGSAEITDVARAFHSVQRTAVTAAVGQAALRRGVGQVFLNLARRKQGLLHRQLALLDGMQRRTHDPDRLEELFRLDHLTTRMRRHAESLIVLSGSAPGRAWRKPVPVIDIVRAAVAEVEDYTRVEVQAMPVSAVEGTAAADLTHLVAELVENATIYSPPDTAVQVRGDQVSNGYAIEIEDRGLGLSAAEYAATNRVLANPPEFDLADSDRLGLFVVARLAERHGVKVMLRRSPFGGTIAIVLVPRSLVTEQTALTAGHGGEEMASLPSRTRKKALAVVTSGTHKGLPRRVRQAAVSPRPAETSSGPPRPPGEDKPAERSPDEVRDLFSAFQRGTQRAREEASEEGPMSKGDA